MHQTDRSGMSAASATTAAAIASIHEDASCRHPGLVLARAAAGKPAAIAVIGAGEGIRTLDPNLGKVVLYP